MGKGTFVGDAIGTVKKWGDQVVATPKQIIKDPLGVAKATVLNPLAMATMSMQGGSPIPMAPAPKKQAPAPAPAQAQAASVGGGKSSGKSGAGMGPVSATINSMPGMQAAPEAPTLTDAADKARLLTYGARNKQSTVLTKGNEKKGPVKTRGLYSPGDEVAKEKLGKSKLTSILGA